MPTFPNVQPLHFSLHLRSTCCADVTLMLSLPSSPHNLITSPPLHPTLYTLRLSPIAALPRPIASKRRPIGEAVLYPITNNQ